MTLDSLSDAHKELTTLREWVAGPSADAAASLYEVGEELLTAHASGITGEFCKSLTVVVAW